MPAASADREKQRKATIDFVRAPHTRNDDEDMHPTRLDETEATLERAISEKKDDEKKRK